MAAVEHPLFDRPVIERRVIEHRGRVMASELHLILVDADRRQARDAVAFLRRLEQRWSRFIPTSDISRVNAGAGRPVRVDPATITLVATMLEAWRCTEGRYDPTVLPILVRAGYAASRADPEERTILPAAAWGIGDPGAVQLDARAGTVTIPIGTALDPGGIGKGLAGDLAVARLLAGGAGGALVGIGGDLAMAGQPPHPDGWFVTVERAAPGDGELCTLAVSGGGVATSSTRSRRWSHQGHDHHHLVDPSSGAESGTDLAAVTVIDTSGWSAEAHATAALLAGTAGVLAYCARHGLTGIALADDGTALATHDVAELDVLPRTGAR